MRIGKYSVRQDTWCWIVSEVKVSARGKEYETRPMYPARFDLALRNVLERMVKDEVTPEATLTDAVATVAHLYRTIGEAE